MGKTNTNTASVPAFEMKGKTANELKAALDGGVVTKAAVVAFLKEREAATGLRAPSKKLLADLTGTVKAKAETPKAEPTVKAEPKAEAKVVTTATPDMSGILARLAALEAEVATLKAALAADEDEDDADMDDEDETDADEDEDEDEDEDGEPMTVEEARDAMNDMALGALRDACRRAGFEPPKGGKAALVEALVQHGIESGMVAAPVAAPVEVKPEPVKAKPSPAPVKATKPTPASVAASIDLGDDLF
jgi:hypothetical protein